MAINPSCRVFLKKEDMRAPSVQNQEITTLDFYLDTPAQRAVNVISKYLGFIDESDKAVVSCLFPRRDEPADENMFEFRTFQDPKIVQSVLKLGNVQENSEKVSVVNMKRPYKVWKYISQGGYEVESESDHLGINRIYHQDRSMIAFHNSASISVFKHGVRGSYYRALQKEKLR